MKMPLGNSPSRFDPFSFFETVRAALFAELAANRLAVFSQRWHAQVCRLACFRASYGQGGQVYRS